MQEWTAQIKEQMQSGGSIPAWCAAHGISTSTYYYRLKRIREELLEAAQTESTPAGNALKITEKPVFAVLPLSQNTPSEITIRMGAYEIEVHNGANASLIEHVLTAVSRL